MKKNLLALSAVALAIVFSSFTVSRVDTNVYMIYDGSSTQTLVGSYTQQSPTQPLQQSGTGILNWFKIVDKNNGVIDQSEFTTRFNQLDASHNSSLNDETVQAGILDRVL